MNIENSLNESQINTLDNSREDYFYYCKILYFISTSIISFLGILVVFENSSLIFHSKNKSESSIIKYILFYSFSWLIIFLLALLVSKFLLNCILGRKKSNDNKNKLLDQEIQSKTLSSKEMPKINKSNNLNDIMLNGNSHFERNNLESLNVENNINNMNQINSQGNKNLSNFIINTTYRNNHFTSEINDLNEKHSLLSFIQFSNKFKLVYINLVFLNYAILAVVGIMLIFKLFNEEIFRNYKHHYKIYLFMFLSFCKSSIILVGFIFKIINKKREANSLKFEIDEDFVKQIEKEIQEANKISGVISPDKNLIKYNDMLNRQDVSSFLNIKNSNLSDIESCKNKSSKDIKQPDKIVDFKIKSIDEITKENHKYKINASLEAAVNKPKITSFKSFGENSSFDKPIFDGYENKPNQENLKIENFNKISVKDNKYIDKKNKIKNNEASKSEFNKVNTLGRNFLNTNLDLSSAKVVDIEQLEPQFREKRNSKIRFHEMKKKEIKEQIKASYLEDNDPQKNKMKEYKKKLEILKKEREQEQLTKSPQIEKASSSRRPFFDENFILENNKIEKDSTNKINNEDVIGNFKFSNQAAKSIKNANDIDDFIKNAKMISKDDLTHIN